MYPNQSLRDRFTDGALDTASGPKVVVMAYDRLNRDLTGALEAIGRGEVAVTHDLLCHAQDLVAELLAMLDVDKWEHGRSLAAIYRYVLELLTEGNVTKRPAPVTEARTLLAELGDAFRQAAVSTVAAAAPAVPAPTADGRAGGFSFKA